MVINVNDFLHSLAKAAVITAAALTPSVPVIYQPVDAQQANLVRNQGVEGPSLADTYGVLKIYGGPGDRTNPAAKQSVQLAVYGTSNDDCWLLAQTLFESLCLDTGGQERRTAPMVAYKAADDSADGQWMVVCVDVIGRPGMLGRDKDTIGGDYQALADSLRPDPSNNQITHESIGFSSIGELKLIASFTVLSSAAGNDLIVWTQSIVVTKAQDVYDILSYPGADPICIRRPDTLPRISQSGSATGLASFPQAPDPILDTLAEQPAIRTSMINDYEMQTTWQYEMIQLDGSDPDISSLISNLARPSNPDFYGGSDD